MKFDQAANPSQFHESELDHVEIIPLDSKIPKQLRALLDWANDPDIRHLHLKFNNANQAETLLTEDHLAHLWRRAETQKNNREMIALHRGVPFSQLSIRYSKEELGSLSTLIATFSIVVGSSKFRGGGWGRYLMGFIENDAKKMGATKAIVSVFEFNTHAINFYRKLSYREISRKPATSWWKNRMWDEIVMEKPL